jgi:hypothetical protein
MTPNQHLREVSGRARAWVSLRRRAPQLQAELTELHTRVHDLELSANHLQLHNNYLEQRLHRSEHTVARFAEAGLPADPAADAEEYARWLTWRPPGDPGSPVPNLHELEKHADALWPPEPPSRLPGIDLRPDAQLAMFSKVAKLGRHFEVQQRRTEPWRYHSDNDDYRAGDALTLHGMLRLIRPRRVVGVGSGYSSAMALDTIEHYLGGKTDVTFIEPQRERLDTLTRRDDSARITVVPTPLQQLPLDTFTALDAGDVLLINSTHVLKTGSDVAWLYGKVLPALRASVWVHIQDVCYPFEYPREWVLSGRAWGEAYIVRAFLAYNTDFEIELFSDWLAYFHRDRIEAELPAMLADTGSALWLRRARTSDRGR